MKSLSLSTNYSLLSTLRGWLIPLVISILIFVFIRPVLAQTIETPHDVKVGTVSGQDNFSQIYYEVEGAREIITDSRYTNGSPATAGEYIVWVGQINGLWQVFLYNLPTKTTTQLTFMGNNVNPRVDDKGKVVWEGWDPPSQGSGEATWQIFFFDGKSTKKLTSGDLSLNPDLSGEYISYGRRDVSGTWRAVVYSIKDDKSVDVTLGEKARNPKVRNGEIFLAAGTSDEEKFPLSVLDLFLLNLMPLTATSSAEPISTESAVLNELIASTSGVIELPMATSSALPSPQATSSGQPVNQ